MWLLEPSEGSRTTDHSPVQRSTEGSVKQIRREWCLLLAGSIQKANYSLFSGAERARESGCSEVKSLKADMTTAPIVERAVA